MAGTHTPGPWHAQPGYHGDERIYVSAGERSGLVAQVNPYRAEDEQKANAALIAAAPDLLDFVKQFVALTAGISDDGLSADGIARRDKARALIAKAEGR